MSDMVLTGFRLAPKYMPLRPHEILERWFKDKVSHFENRFPSDFETGVSGFGLMDMPEKQNDFQYDISVSNFTHKCWTTKIYRDEGSATYVLMRDVGDILEALNNINTKKIFWRIPPTVESYRDFDMNYTQYVGRVRFSFL